MMSHMFIKATVPVSSPVQGRQQKHNDHIVLIHDVVTAVLVWTTNISWEPDLGENISWLLFISICGNNVIMIDSQLSELKLFSPSVIQKEE